MSILKFLGNFTVYCRCDRLAITPVKYCIHVYRRRGNKHARRVYTLLTLLQQQKSSDENGFKSNYNSQYFYKHYFTHALHCRSKSSSGSTSTCSATITPVLPSVDWNHSGLPLLLECLIFCISRRYLYPPLRSCFVLLLSM